MIMRKLIISTIPLLLLLMSGIASAQDATYSPAWMGERNWSTLLVERTCATSNIRNNGLHSYPNLCTDSARTRSAVGIQAKPDRRAHHIYPQSSLRSLNSYAQSDLNKNWDTDGIDNLIALPYTPAEQVAMGKINGHDLPLHRGPHEGYSREADMIFKCFKEKAERAGDITRDKEFTKVMLQTIDRMQEGLVNGKWGNTLCGHPNPATYDSNTCVITSYISNQPSNECSLVDPEEDE